MSTSAMLDLQAKLGSNRAAQAVQNILPHTQTWVALMQGLTCDAQPSFAGAAAPACTGCDPPTRAPQTSAAAAAAIAELSCAVCACPKPDISSKSQARAIRSA